MKKFSERSRKIEMSLATFSPRSPDLVFPVEPGFISETPLLPWPVMFQRNEETLVYKTRRPNFEENRLAEKCPEEFLL